MTKKNAIRIGAFIAHLFLTFVLYLIFLFITNEFNPIVWNIWIKSVFAFLYLSIVANVWQQVIEKQKGLSNE